MGGGNEEGKEKQEEEEGEGGSHEKAELLFQTNIAVIFHYLLPTF
jgi:hypothetical protein